MFDDNFIESLPTNRMRAARVLCEKFVEIDQVYDGAARIEHYDNYLEALGALEIICEASGLPFDTPDLGSDESDNIQMIRTLFFRLFEYLKKQVTHNTLSAARDKFRIKFSVGFVYEFSDGDLKRVQTLINELRNLIVGSELFEANHKDRILKKLESLQGEIHKKVSSIDKFWGLIGEAGVALGKFGKDAKPIVDRIREIAQIIWRTQARAEELPSGTPLPLLTESKEQE